jgi:hypothetical protein
VSSLSEPVGIPLLKNGLAENLSQENRGSQEAVRSFPVSHATLFPQIFIFSNEIAGFDSGNGFVSCFVSLRFPFPR